MLCSAQKFKCEVIRLHIFHQCFRQKSLMVFYTRSWRQRHTLIGVTFFHSLKKVLGNISGGTVPILRPFQGFFWGDTVPSRTHSGVQLTQTLISTNSFIFIIPYIGRLSLVSCPTGWKIPNGFATIENGSAFSWGQVGFNVGVIFFRSQRRWEQRNQQPRREVKLCQLLCS